MDNLGEKILFERLKLKDREAFSRAYDQYNEQIYRFIYYKIGNSDEAHDLLSAVFLKSWNYIQANSVKDEKSLRSLFYKIARNVIIDEYRRQSTHGTISINDPDREVVIADEKEDLNSQVEQSLEMSRLEKKLLALKEEYREIIIMKYIEQMTTKEIAEILGKPRGAVRVLAHRSIKALRELMK
jgi:RNA polymerase sigma-70 factor, ECF subfamily